MLEIPLRYRPSPAVASKAHARLALAYLRTFWTLWKLRIRSRRPTTITARTTARSRCSATGSGAATGTSSSHRGRGPGARRRLRIEPHHRRAPGGQRRARHAGQQAAVRPAVSGPARPRLRLCAAVCRRELSVRALLAGDRARAYAPSMIDELCRVLRARRTAGARHARLRPMGVGVDREAVRLLRAGRLRRRAHRALHADRTARAVRLARVHARGDSLHSARRTDPRLPEARATTEMSQHDSEKSRPAHDNRERRVLQRCWLRFSERRLSFE